MEDEEVFLVFRTRASKVGDLMAWLTAREAEQSKAIPRRRRAHEGRAPKGVRLPQRDYRLPILEAVAERGGSARMADIVEAVGKKLEGQLPAIDFERVPSGRGIRWKNRTQWVGSFLRRDGYLRKNSPRGVWELTEKGWNEVGGRRRNRSA